MNPSSVCPVHAMIFDFWLWDIMVLVQSVIKSAIRISKVQWSKDPRVSRLITVHDGGHQNYHGYFFWGHFTENTPDMTPICSKG